MQNKIIKPTFILDENRCRKNIFEMSQKAKRNNVEFRPHFKTHQSIEIGKWFKEFGVSKITVSSLEMARYFAKDWNDITVAFPVNILEIETINELANRINLNLLIESKEAAEFLTTNLQSKVVYFIKIDVGYHRTGILPNDFDRIDEILDSTETESKLNFRGFLTHAGHTYHCRSKEDILKIHEESIKILKPLEAKYTKKYTDLIMSVGDTPSCSIAENFSIFNEIRPGNFVFYDLSQNQIGSCEIEQISCAVACPIVSIHKDRNEIVIYGGGVHLSKERMDDEEFEMIYGKVVEKRGDKWGDLISGMFVKKLSQEHGIVAVPKSKIKDFKIGDLLYILPVHSCMTANLLKPYQTTEGKIIERL